MTAKPYVVSGKALIRDHEGRILLIKRSMSCKNFKGQWELPGGKADPGETIDAALRREVKEETGLVLRDLHLAGVAQAKIRRYRIVYIVLETRAKSGKVHLSKEHTRSAWVRLDRFARYKLTPGVGEFMRDYTKRKGT